MFFKFGSNCSRIYRKYWKKFLCTDTCGVLLSVAYSILQPHCIALPVKGKSVYKEKYTEPALWVTYINIRDLYKYVLLYSCDGLHTSGDSITIFITCSIKWFMRKKDMNVIDHY